MKKFRDSLILLTIIFSGLFLLNTGFMYAFFGINALNPVQREEAGNRTALAGDIVKHAAGTGVAAAETGAEGYVASGAEGMENTGAGAVPDSATGGTNSAVTGFMTAGEVQYLGELDLRDKLAALTILSKIGSSESDRIYELAKDGVSDAEMGEIRGLLEKKLSAAEMEVLYGILDKSRRLYAENASNQKEKGRQAVEAR